MLFPLESPPFVPINEVVQIGIPNPANGICETPVGREASMRPTERSSRRLISRPRKARIFHLRWSRHIILFLDRKSTRLNSSHVAISFAVFCLDNKTRESLLC